MSKINKHEFKPKKKLTNKFKNVYADIESKVNKNLMYEDPDDWKSELEDTLADIPHNNFKIK